MGSWKTKSRRTILDHSEYLRVEEHKVELPDGQVLDWSWVITPDFVNVVAVTSDRRFLCFRQTKYAYDGIALAVPGGYIEPNEDPLSAAKRELLEETGYQSPSWHPLGEYAVDGNRGAGSAKLFLAVDAVKTAEPDPDDLEELELVLLTQPEIEKALNRGEFPVLPWTTAVALALLHLGSKPR